MTLNYLIARLWGIGSTPLLALVPNPIKPGVLVTVTVQFMGPIELFNHFLLLKPFNCVQKKKMNIKLKYWY